MPRRTPRPYSREVSTSSATWGVLIPHPRDRVAVHIPGTAGEGEVATIEKRYFFLRISVVSCIPSPRECARSVSFTAFGRVRRCRRGRGKIRYNPDTLGHRRRGGKPLSDRRRGRSR